MERTSNVKELVEIYSASDVYLNLTYEDNFPTTNLEAAACGTKVITYKTGGAPEAIKDGCGYVVEKGDLEAVFELLPQLCGEAKDKLLVDSYKESCYFSCDRMVDENLSLYKELGGIANECAYKTTD